MAQEPATHVIPLQAIEDHSEFQSILFDCLQVELSSVPPEFFPDLNLDQVVAAITARRDEYELQALFQTLLPNPEIIRYRQGVFRDLDNEKTLDSVRHFSASIRTMRSHLALSEKLNYKYQKGGWFLEAIQVYADGIAVLQRDLNRIELRSNGLLRFRDYLNAYAESTEFATLVSETQIIAQGLSRVQYCLHIKGNRVEVNTYEGEPDYAAEVLQTFDRFRQGGRRQYHFRLPSSQGINHVEAAILDLVTRLYPEIFASLDEYWQRHRAYLNSTIERFDREIQFYIAVIDHIDRLKKSGLRFCLPIVDDISKEVHGHEIFDLALANNLVSEHKPVVVNDFHLRGPERILVITGPNQGGKTTFARTFGQLHYLAKIGCPVPGSDAKLFFFDELFTHFETEENIHNRVGKLEDDLLRMHKILQAASPKSVLIMNESFLSTTLHDAVFLSKEIVAQIIERDMLCVAVTFIDELSSINEKTVSMVSTVDTKDPAIRTFKVVRKTADGLAYAAALAQKHGLTRKEIKRRIAENTKGGDPA